MSNVRKWVLDNYEKDEIKNITEHGMVSGFSGLTYYNETTAFHNLHEEEIWDMLWDDSESQGTTIMELIASFNGQKNVGSMTQFKNLLSWYAVERVCNDLINEEEVA